MPLCSLLFAALIATASDPDLAEAERAFEDAHYEAVLPALERARAHALDPADAHRALELEALTHSAFDERPAAVEAFRKLLGLDPDYAPDPAYGPKVKGLYEHAKRLGPRPQHVEHPKLVPPPLEDRPKLVVPLKEPEQPALYQRWYVWAGAGVAAVVAAGVATGIAVSRPQVPNGNLGTGALR